MTAITSESVRLSVLLKFATRINFRQSVTFGFSIFSEGWSISGSDVDQMDQLCDYSLVADPHLIHLDQMVKHLHLLSLGATDLSDLLI